MFPLRSSDSGGSAGGSTSPRARRRAAAVAGGTTNGNYRTAHPPPPPPQQVMQQVQQQQNFQQSVSVSRAGSAPVALPRSSNTASRGASFHLLDSESRRAAIAAYPSASEVLLRHSSSQTLPSFRPRPQPHVVAAASEGFPAGDAASVGSPRPGTSVRAAPPGATVLPTAGQYVSIPLRSSTPGASPRVFAPRAYFTPRPGLQQQQQRPVLRHEAGHRSVAGQPQQIFPFYHPTDPSVPQSLRLQLQQQQYRGQPTPGVQTQLLYRQGTGPRLVSQKQLQQQYSLPALFRKKEEADVPPPRRLKSALRSQAPSQPRGATSPSSLKTAGSVRFALHEDEVFRGAGAAPVKALQEQIVRPSGVGDGVASATAPQATVVPPQESPRVTTAAAEAALVAAGAAFPAAGGAAGGTKEGGVPTLQAGRSAAKAPPGGEEQAAGAVQSAATRTPVGETLQMTPPTTTRKEDEKQVRPPPVVADRGLEPTKTPASSGGAAAAAGEQLAEQRGKTDSGAATDKKREEFVLICPPLAPTQSESPRHAGFSDKEARQSEGTKPSQEEESRSQLQETPVLQEIVEPKFVGVSAAAAEAGRAKADAKAVNVAPAQQQAEQQQQQPEQPRQEEVPARQVDTVQGLQPDIGQQEAERQERQPKETVQQAPAKESKEVVQQLKAVLLPCLWLGRADHPHVCINFSASFQPKLLVRRSSAPALHIYAEGQLPVKDYFVPESASRTAKEKVAGTLAGSTSTALGDVDPTAVSAAGTANSKAKPEAAISDGAAPSHQKEKRREELLVKRDREEAGDVANKPTETGPRRESGIAVSSDTTARTEKDDTVGDAAASHRGAPAGEGVAETGVKRTAEESKEEVVSRRDLLVLKSFFSFVSSGSRSFSDSLHFGGLALDNAAKTGQYGSRRPSYMSTDDELSVDEQEWRSEMARPTILLHRPFHKREERPPTQISSAAVEGGAAADTNTAGRSHRVLIVVDTTTEWWPSVQVRWVDAKKREVQETQQQQEQQGDQRSQHEASQQREGGGTLGAGDETQERENILLIHKGHPTNCSGVCLWSNHRPTFLDLSE